MSVTLSNGSHAYGIHVMLLKFYIE
jgi:hypothetical protein